MTEHTEQHLDNLAKKTMTSSGLKSPSVDFTANVMKNIEGITIGETVTYKPLITKYGWFAIIAILTGVSIYVMFNNIGSSILIDAVDYSIISNNKVTNVLSGITFSKTLMYTIVFFGIAWFIQITMMKQYLNKRLEY